VVLDSRPDLYLRIKRFGEISIDSKAGTRLDLKAVFHQISEWLDELDINIVDCDVVVRIDGRPNGKKFEVMLGVSIVHHGSEICFPGGYIGSRY